jgi:copper chaperone CopZ
MYGMFRGMEAKVSDNCHVEPLRKQVSTEETNEAQMATLAVEGMGCVHCATRVRNGLLSLDGVVSANIDLAAGLALVDYIPARTNPDALIQAVAAAGHDGHHNYRVSIPA